MTCHLCGDTIPRTADYFVIDDGRHHGRSYCSRRCVAAQFTKETNK